MINIYSSYKKSFLSKDKKMTEEKVSKEEFYKRFVAFHGQVLEDLDYKEFVEKESEEDKKTYLRKGRVTEYEKFPMRDKDNKVLDFDAISVFKSSMKFPDAYDPITLQRLKYFLDFHDRYTCKPSYNRLSLIFRNFLYKNGDVPKDDLMLLRYCVDCSFLDKFFYYQVSGHPDPLTDLSRFKPIIEKAMIDAKSSFFYRPSSIVGDDEKGIKVRVLMVNIDNKIYNYSFIEYSGYGYVGTSIFGSGDKVADKSFNEVIENKASISYPSFIDFLTHIVKDKIKDYHKHVNTFVSGTEMYLKLNKPKEYYKF